MKIFNNYESDKALLSQRLSYCFSRMCFQHENAAACWYHIQHIENSDRNLSSYFELDSDTYNSALLHTGLGKRRKGSNNLTISIIFIAKYFNTDFIQFCIASIWFFIRSKDQSLSVFSSTLVSKSSSSD